MNLQGATCSPAQRPTAQLRWSRVSVKMASKIESTENTSTKCKTALLVSKLLKNAGISCTLFRWQTISFKIATTKPAFLLIGFSYIFLHQNLHIADYTSYFLPNYSDLPKQPLPCLEIVLSVLKASCAAGAQWQRALCFMEAGTVGQRWTNFPLWGTDILVNRFATQLSRCVRERCSWACGNCA